MMTKFPQPQTSQSTGSMKKRNLPYATGPYKKIDNDCLFGKQKYGIIVSVESPDEFYVQINDFYEDFKKLLFDLNAYYTELTEDEFKLIDYNKGMPCAARADEDKVWYRGQVTLYAAKKRMVTVYFVDYGNQEILPVNEVKFLKKDFFQLPATGIRCRLPNAQNNATTNNWPSEIVNELKKFIGEPMMLNFGRYYDQDGSWEIELSANDEFENFYSNLYRRFIELGNNAPSSSSSSSSVNDFVAVSSSEIANPDFLCFKFLPNGFPDAEVTVDLPYNISVVNYCSLEEVYLILTSQNDMVELENEMAQVYGCAATKGQLKSFDKLLETDTGCVALYDNIWSRCEVVEPPTDEHSDSYRLLRVDYGEKCNVATTKVFPVVKNELILNTPKFTLPCRIKDAKMPNGFEEKRNLAEFMTTLVRNDCKFFGRDENNRFVVEIYMKNGQTLVSYLHQQKLANYLITPESQMSLVPPKKRQSSIADVVVVEPSVVFTNGSTDSTTKMETLCLIYGLPPLKFNSGQNSFLDVDISHVDNPGRFYVWLRNYYDDFKKMETEMNNVYANGENHSPAVNPVKGDLGVCRLADGSANWYRCVVTERSTVAVVDVFLCDYGRSEKVSKSSLKLLDVSFRQFPPMALPCSLKDVLVNENTIENFKNVIFDHCKDSSFVIRLEGKLADGGGFEVTLFEEKGSNLHAEITKPQQFRRSSASARCEQKFYDVRARRGEQQQNRYFR